VIVSDTLRGNVVSFGADDDYIDVPYFAEATGNLDGFTASFWIKPVVPDSNDIREIFYGTNMHMTKTYHPNSQFYTFRVNNITAGSVHDYFYASNDGNWHHVVLVYNGTDVFTYMDMKRMTIKPFSGKTAEPYYFFTISSLFEDSGFNGRIDDFMFYDRALSYSELQDIHEGLLVCDGTDTSCGTAPNCQNCDSFDYCYSTSYYRNYYCSGTSCASNYVPTTSESDANENCFDGIDNDCDGNTDAYDSDCSITFPTDYLAYLRFEESTGDITPDETGNYDGWMRNDAYIVSDTEKGKVVSFDGDKDSVDLGAFDGTENLDEFTISLWAKAAVAEDTVNRYVFYKYFNMEMFRDTAGGYLFEFYNNTYSHNIGVAVCPQDTKWHHIVVIYNGTDFFSYIDLNREQLFRASGITKESGSSFSISSAHLSPITSFYGRMDDFMFYDRALSYEEVLNIYDNQAPASCEGTDESCGVAPNCQDCNDFDACYSTQYRDYYCSGTSCTYTIATEPESDANENCFDGIDNDCDGKPDAIDPQCSISFPTDYLAYWRFEEAPGGITPDETGDHPGWLQGNAHIVNDNLKDSVMDFDGDVDSVAFEDFDETENLDEFTISLWARPATAQDTTSRYVFYKQFNMDMFRTELGDYILYPKHINAYLEPFGITAKDIRGFHANEEMRAELKKVRKSVIDACKKV